MCGIDDGERPRAFGRSGRFYQPRPMGVFRPERPILQPRPKAWAKGSAPKNWPEGAIHMACQSNERPFQGRVSRGGWSGSQACGLG